MKNEDPTFWNKLTETNLDSPVNNLAEYLEDDVAINEDDTIFNNDSSIEPMVLQAVLVSGSVPEGLKVRKDGSYMCLADDSVE